MNLVLLGTNYKYSPINVREALSFSKKEIKKSLINLTSYESIKAGVILSTCNRVELYASVFDIEEGLAQLKRFLFDYKCKNLDNLKPYLYIYIGKEAIFHLFKVSCGIDSQIIGETQILEQVKFAYEQARAIEVTDRLLEMVFNNAIRVSQRVRQETGISEGKVSIANIVLELIKIKFNSIEDKTVLVIGVGKISELVSKYLKKEKTKTVFIANRTFEKAKELAEFIGEEAVGFDRLKEKLQEADIIISATSSPHLILKKEDFVGINKPLLIIDLAVPRDVDTAVRDINGVSLFDLDDLDFIIEKNLDKRRQIIPITLEIIKEEVESLCLKETLELEPAGALLP